MSLPAGELKTQVINSNSDLSDSNHSLGDIVDGSAKPLPGVEYGAKEYELGESDGKSGIEAEILDFHTSRNFYSPCEEPEKLRK